MAITRDAEQDTHFDPSACVEVVVSNDGVGWVGWCRFLKTPNGGPEGWFHWNFDLVLGGPRPSNIECFNRGSRLF